MDPETLKWGLTRRRNAEPVVLKTKPNRGKVGRGKWTADSMQLALEDIAVGRRKLREAARYYSIPESSIRAWKSGKVSSKKSGPPTVLTAEEENALVEWCEERQRVAHCVSLTLLRCKVAIVQNLGLKSEALSKILDLPQYRAPHRVPSVARKIATRACITSEEFRAFEQQKQHDEAEKKRLVHERKEEREASKRAKALALVEKKGKSLKLQKKTSKPKPLQDERKTKMSFVSPLVKQ